MNAILDTGPWVALIDRSESKHDICVQWLKSYSGKLYLQTQKSAICHYALIKHPNNLLAFFVYPVKCENYFSGAEPISPG